MTGMNSAEKERADRLRRNAEELQLIIAEEKATTQAEKDIIHMKRIELSIIPYSRWWRWGYLGSVRRARKALEKQEPVTPKTDGTSIYDVDGLIVCGKCGGSLGMPEVFKFCPWCGRTVKWDE